MDWLHPRNFSRPEKAWVIGYGCILIVLTSLPFLVFYSLTPAHQQYAWSSVFYYDDYFQYYAWAQHIARGEWLIRNYYTGNPEASFALFNPYFIIQGWTTRILGNMYLAHHVLRICAVAVFSYVSYAYLSLYVTGFRARATAQLLMLGGGIEFPWYYYITQSREPTPLADPHIFKILYRYGHLTACLSLLLIIFGTHVAMKRGEGKNVSALAGVALCSFLLGLINPYYIVLIAAVFCADGVLLLIRKHPGNLLSVCAAAAGGAIALVHYKSQRLTGSLNAIAFDDPIGVLDVILFCAPLLLIAVPGMYVWLRSSARSEDRGSERFLFPLIWLFIVIALSASPLRFRARMTFGMQIPLIIFALQCGRFSAARNVWRWIPIAMMVVDPAFTFYKEYVDFTYKGTGRIDLALAAAFEGLDKRAKPGDLTLAPPMIGDLLPAFSRTNTYVGHSFQTDDFYRKAKEVDAFITSMPDSERLEFLRRIGARFVLVPPMSDALHAAFKLPGWNRIYAKSGYEIYTNAD